MASLQILSLGRNQIKKLEGFDGVSETLQELWISYNLIEKLVRLSNVREAPILCVVGHLQVMMFTSLDCLSRI